MAETPELLESLLNSGARKVDVEFKNKDGVVSRKEALTDVGTAVYYRKLSAKLNERHFTPTPLLNVESKLVKWIALYFFTSRMPEADGGIDKLISEPPRAAKLALLLIPRKDREGLIGDLEEEFTTILVPEYGLTAAKRWYCWQVFLAICWALRGVLKALLQGVTNWLLRSS